MLPDGFELVAAGVGEVARDVDRAVDRAVAIDEDAGTLYAEHGIELVFPPDHPFAADERAWWTAAAAGGRLTLVRDRASGADAAVVIVGWLDGEPYLEQLSARRTFMRRGLGRALVEHAAAWAAAVGGEALWLTTYAHLPFNRPWYERLGFAVVPPPHRPELAAALAEQRRWLPFPDERVAMRRPLGPR